LRLDLPNTAGEGVIGRGRTEQSGVSAAGGCSTFDGQEAGDAFGIQEKKSLLFVKISIDKMLLQRYIKGMEDTRMTTTENAKRLLEGLVEKLDTQTIAAFCQKRLFASEADLPMSKWSRLNQFAAFISQTSDARGVNQWREVGRWPRKGSHAIYILVPMFRTAKPEQPTEGPTDQEGEEIKRLSGFRCMPVFRVEDTEGKELDYQQTLNAFDPSKFPLYQLAVSMGVKVAGGLMSYAYGSFSPDSKQIKLGTDDPTTFLHELSHAVDNQLPGKSEDYAFNEVVAELSSCFLCTLYNLPHHEQHTKAYIQSYQGRASVAFQIMKAVDRVLEIYGYISAFEAGSQEQKQA